MPAETKTIGILGGMGPAATVELMSRIIRKTPAKDDDDHLRMLVDNNPKVPSRIKAILEGTGADPLPELQRMAKGLESSGADFLVMACNTAHHYHAELAASVAIPFLSIVDVAASRLAEDYPQARRIGFLASPAVRQTGVYDSAFGEQGLIIVYPDEEDSAELLGIIREVKEGLTGSVQRERFHRVARDLASGVDAVLVACTELSMLPLPETERFLVLDTLDLLADAVIAKARGG
ncbi:MAG TPA: amino acid racemase [Pseudaminobacter sp.]|nr:amino acid racemase [Pseudaminobacter sp.]